MASVLVQHKVEDYDKWRAVFYQYGSTRGASGSRGTHLMGMQELGAIPSTGSGQFVPSVTSSRGQPGA